MFSSFLLPSQNANASDIFGQIQGARLRPPKFYLVLFSGGICGFSWLIVQPIEDGQLPWKLTKNLAKRTLLRAIPRKMISTRHFRWSDNLFDISSDNLPDNLIDIFSGLPSDI